MYRVKLGVIAIALSLALLAAILYNGLMGAVFIAVGTALWLIFKPSSGLLIFLAALFWPWRPSENLLLWLADWIAILLILGWILSYFLSGEAEIEWTGLEVPILLFLGALAFSLKNAWDFRLGFVAWIHNLLYFLTFFVLAERIRTISLEKLVKSYCILCILFTVTSVAVLFQTGGQGRGFGGLSGFGYTDLVLPVFFFSLANYFLAPRGESKWMVVVFWILLGILASESRNAFFGLAFGTAFLSLLLSKATTVSNQAMVRRRLLALGLVAVLFGIVLLVFLPSYLPSITARWNELSMNRPNGTIAARLMLWGIAIKAFFSHPLTGIGFNQFQRIMDVFPELKNLTFYLWFRGISVHNVFLSILVETGIVGALSFVFFQIVCLRKAWRAFRLAKEWEEKAFGLGLLTTFFFITISSYYGWQWFWWTNAYEYMFFLAVLVVFNQRMIRKYEA